MRNNPFRAIHRKLDFIIERVVEMAVSQDEFDAALTEFFLDLDEGLAAIAAALAAAGAPVDLSAELSAVADAKAKFDAAVAADTTPPAPPPAP